MHPGDIAIVGMLVAIGGFATADAPRGRGERPDAVSSVTTALSTERRLPGAEVARPAVDAPDLASR